MTTEKQTALLPCPSCHRVCQATVIGESAANRHIPERVIVTCTVCDATYYAPKSKAIDAD